MVCICEFCSAELSDKYKLKTHQKSEKCLNKQKEYKKIEIITKDLKQLLEIKDNENKILKETISKSEQTIFKLEQTIKELSEWKEKQILKLEEKLEKTTDVIIEQAKKPRTTIKNTVNNWIEMPIAKLDLSFGRLDNIFKNHLKLETLIDLFKNLPKFAHEFIAMNENKELTFICTDKSRGEFRYKDENNEMVTDSDAKIFTSTFMKVADPYIDSLLEKEKPNKKTYKNPKIFEKKAEIYNQIIEDINELRNNPDNRKYIKNLANMVYLGPKKRKIKELEYKKKDGEEKKISKEEIERNNYKRKEFKKIKIPVEEKKDEKTLLKESLAEDEAKRQKEDDERDEKNRREHQARMKYHAEQKEKLYAEMEEKEKERQRILDEKQIKKKSI
jgi:hypothetical protein